MSNSSVILILFGGCMVGAMIVVIWMLFARSKYAKEAKDHVQVQYVPVAGPERYELCPIENGLITFTSKDRKVAKAWLVSNVSLHPATYPRYMPAFIGAHCDKVIVDEMSLEPISNRSGKREFSPAALCSLVNQKFLSVAQEAQRLIDMANKAAAAKESPMIMYVLIFIAAALAGASLYFGYTNHADNQIIKQGLGIASKVGK